MPSAFELCALSIPTLKAQLGTGPKKKRLASLQALECLVAGTRKLTQKRIRIK